MTKRFSILLSKSTVHEARIELAADTEELAKLMAKAQADDGMVNWTEVFAETEAEAESDG